MSIATVTIAVALVLAGPTEAPPEPLANGGIVHGGPLGVGVSAPPGWVFDSESGVEQGLHAVLYPEGSRWADADRVMYVNVAPAKEGQTLAEFIEGDLAAFKEKAPDLVVQVEAPIHLVGDDVAQVRLYGGDSWGNSEAIAYAAQDATVAIYVLSCRTPAARDESLAAFRSMVAGSFLVRVASEEPKGRRGKRRARRHGGSAGAETPRR